MKSRASLGPAVVAGVTEKNCSGGGTWGWTAGGVVTQVPLWHCPNLALCGTSDTASLPKPPQHIIAQPPQQKARRGRWPDR